MPPAEDDLHSMREDVPPEPVAPLTFAEAVENARLAKERRERAVRLLILGDLEVIE